MTLSFVTVSRTSVLSSSNCFCMRVYLGEATTIITAIIAPSTGMTTSIILASEGLSRNDITIAPISITGERNIPRKRVCAKFCICVISFVILVIREPVVNSSILVKEKLCIFEKTSPLTPAASRAEPLTAKFAPKTPKSIINAAIISIYRPFFSI